MKIKSLQTILVCHNVSFDKQRSDIARVLSQMSEFEQREDSLLHFVSKHINNGFSCIEYDAASEILARYY